MRGVFTQPGPALSGHPYWGRTNSSSPAGSNFPMRRLIFAQTSPRWLVSPVSFLS